MTRIAAVAALATPLLLAACATAPTPAVRAEAPRQVLLVTGPTLPLGDGVYVGGGKWVAAPSLPKIVETPRP